MINKKRRADPDQGSISIFMAAAAFVMIVLVGLAVDLGGRVYDQQRLGDVADQAARTGGEQVQAGTVIQGGPVTLNTAAAAAAARQYLATAGVAGTVSITDGDTIEVDTTGSYPTKFLSIIGIVSLPVHGRSQAQLIPVREGVAQ